MSDSRTESQLREHYEVERRLAAELRKAPKHERRTLYGALYDELFRLVPHHPQLTKKTSPSARRAQIARELRVLGRFLSPDVSFLEIGAGDCALSLEVSKVVKQVYALDVSSTIMDKVHAPANVTQVLSDGCDIPLADRCVDVVYSNQLMEHLHPDDALEQLTHVARVLVRGGIYVCITPNRLTGPHDISQHFDIIASGFHLREYTVTELRKMFVQVGFGQVEAYITIKDKCFKTPQWMITVLESSLEGLPIGVAKSIGRQKLVRRALDVAVVGLKKT